VGIDQPLLDAPQVDVEAGDAVRGRALEVRVDERFGQDAGVPGGDARGLRELLAQPSDDGRIVLGQAQALR
jgi:hypothetical protein